MFFNSNNINNNTGHSAKKGLTMLNHIGSHKTVVEFNSHSFLSGLNVTRVLYHGTAVTQFNNKEILLNTGGYFTATTKKRMNQASQEFNLGYYVFQKNYVWYCNYNNKIFSFSGNKLSLPIAH